MKRKCKAYTIAVSGLLLFFSVDGLAQDSSIVTDRPGRMYASSVLTVKNLQFETGTAITLPLNGVQGTDYTVNEMAVRYGLHRTGELRTGYSWTNISVADGTGRNGEWVPYAGYKQSLWNRMTSRFSMAMVATGYFPTCDRCPITYDVHLPASITLNARNSLAVMPALTGFGTSLSSGLPVLSVLFNHSWGEQLTQFFQVYFQDFAGDQNQFVPGTGIMWIFRPDMQADLSTEYIISGDRQYFYTSLGFSYSFGTN